jgi:hypothetical protein
VKPLTTEPEVKIIASMNGIDRWQIYTRLQELNISCSCGMNQPLTVEIRSVATAIQVWSVVRQFTVPRYKLIQALERCLCCDA